MALTQRDTIKFAVDELKSSGSGVIITKSGNETDLTGAVSVTGFDIAYAHPTGSVIRFLFRYSDSANWFKLTTAGKAKTITNETPDYELLAEKGNTVSELSALTQVPAFAGKKILTAIGLGTSDIENVIPKVRLSIKTKNSTQTLKTTEYSPEYKLGTKGQIDRITYSSEITGNAGVKVYAQLRDESGNLGEWQEVSGIRGIKAQGVKLKAEYTVKEVHGGESALENVRIFYKDGSSITAGSETGELVSLTQNWYMNLRHCRLTVKHAPLEDANIEGYVCFREEPSEVRNEQLGIGSGERRTYELEHKEGIRYDSVKIYYDKEIVQSEYEVNSEVGRVTCTAPEGAIITCSYEYGWGREEWQRMTETSSVSHEEYDQTEFRYTRPEESGSKSISSVKVVMRSDSGSIKKESIGKGTGKMQSYKLSHQVSDGTVKIYANGLAMSSKSYALQEDTHYVKIAGSYGSELTASYNWTGKTPVIYQTAAVYSS